MRGLGKKGVFIILIALVAIFGFVSVWMLVTPHTVTVMDTYSLRTFIADPDTLKKSSEGSGTGVDLSFGVLYYPGEIVEGSTIMNECVLAIYNPGPETVELSVSTFEWRLGDYYGGAGYYNIGSLPPEDVALISCTDVFGSEGTKIIIPVPSNKFILQNVPLVVKFHTSYGDFEWEGSVDYIPDRALVPA